MAIAPEVKRKTNATVGEVKEKKRRKQLCLLRSLWVSSWVSLGRA